MMAHLDAFKTSREMTNTAKGRQSTSQDTNTLDRTIRILEVDMMAITGGFFTQDLAHPQIVVKRNTKLGTTSLQGTTDGSIQTTITTTKGDKTTRFLKEPSLQESLKLFCDLHLPNKMKDGLTWAIGCLKVRTISSFRTRAERARLLFPIMTKRQMFVMFMWPAFLVK